MLAAEVKSPSHAFPVAGDPPCEDTPGVSRGYYSALGDGYPGNRAEYVESDGAVYVIELGGRELVTPDPVDPSAPLRARWRELKGGWPL